MRTLTKREEARQISDIGNILNKTCQMSKECRCKNIVQNIPYNTKKYSKGYKCPFCNKFYSLEEIRGE